MLDSHYFIYRMVHDLYAAHSCKPRIIHFSPYLHTIKNLVAVSLEEPFYINSGIVTKKGRQVYEDEQHLIDYLQEITKEM